MDFTLPESADDVRTLARDIATKISTPDHLAELEASSAPIDATLWRELGTAGLLGLELPSSAVGDNGGDLSAIENSVVAEELERVLARVPFGPHACAALPVVAAHGSAGLRDRLLAAGATGEVIVTTAVEEDLGVDPLSPTATLAEGAGGSTLSGTKVNVPYGQAADAFAVTALSADGPVVLIVPADASGVRIVTTTSTGLIPTAQVEFTDVAVDSDQILSGGTVAVHDLINRSTLAVCAEQSGIVSRALELTAEYAREREQFGRPIGSFQAVAQRLANGYIDVQGLSLTTTQAAWMLSRADSDHDADLHTAIATAKFWAAEAGHRVAHTTIHVHGGVGLDTSHPVHRYFLRAKQNEFTLGSAPAALRSIGGDLAQTPA
ncbi:acyl-CoA dehydrogenase family protein [Gordonia sp. NPDC003424]